MERVITAVAVFAGTNVDDLVVLTVLFLASRAGGSPRGWQIWVGQYLGIGALVTISALGALGLTLVPDRWVRLLGLVPLALGGRGLIRTLRSGPTEERVGPARGLLPIAGLTIANGADNIAVYTPILRTADLTGGVVMAAVFALLIAVWCLVASWLGGHRRVIDVVERFGHWLVPLVFIAIGAVILLS